MTLQCDNIAMTQSYHFGDVKTMAVHRNKSETITVRVTPETKALMKQVAEARGRTVTQQMEWLFRQDANDIIARMNMATERR